MTSAPHSRGDGGGFSRHTPAARWRRGPPVSAPSLRPHRSLVGDGAIKGASGGLGRGLFCAELCCARGLLYEQRRVVPQPSGGTGGRQV